MLQASAASVIFGFSYLMCAIAFEYVSPQQLLCMRYLLAFLLMSLLLLFRVIRVSYRGKPVMKLFLMGLFYPVIGFLCDNYGTYYTSSALAGSIVAVAPVVTMLVSVLILHERISRRQALFALLAVVGAVLISAGNFTTAGTSGKGIALMLGAVVTNSLFTVLNKKYAGIFTVEEKSYFQITMAAVSFTLLALPGFFNGSLDPAVLKQPRLWMAVGYLGILVSVGALLLLNESIKKITPTQSSILSNLVPVISVVSGVAILHDAFSILQMLGVGIVIFSASGVMMGEK